MKTAIIGFPRIGSLRELKFASEKYFRHEISEEELQAVAKKIRDTNLSLQKDSGLDFIPSNDFSFYDGILDTTVLLGAIPARYQELGVSELDTYFAMARGYQDAEGDVKAFAMKKWYNTNYHYMVPELDDSMTLSCVGTKPFDLFSEAKAQGVITKSVIVGPYTFLKLARYMGKKTALDFVDEIILAYTDILCKFGTLSAEWVQFDEPSLVMDMSAEDISLFESLYSKILSAKGSVKVLLQTYFGDVRDCYQNIMALPFDGVGLDFIEGKETLALIEEYAVPENIILFAGVINGKNIWRNNYAKTLSLVKKLEGFAKDIVISTSCSLLHVPVTLEHEKKMNPEYKKHFSYASEKLEEIAELKVILESGDFENLDVFKANSVLFSTPRAGQNSEVQAKVAALSEKDFVRLPVFKEREAIQKAKLKLPLFPTTTIGSFPQTSDVRLTRAAFKKGDITEEEYTNFMQKKIADCVAMQEEIGLDVLVHGEFERNDMVEYFGECLDGYLFTEKAWVQSYGTRCVKPPVVWGDISRAKPMTVKWSSYAQSLTQNPMKGMLTGPVTILNWSFPREDISLKESAYQIGLAIREEVLDLEANGIQVIQVDEAALREKLPLRRSDWKCEYLDWAIPAFRLVHSACKADTQLHTHMCYSEFADIITDIDDMDADVITFEASRSDLTILDVLKENHFRTEVGPGVYDIHSPRVPSEQEIKIAVEKMLDRIPAEKLWINPDCGLKTRGNEETVESLKNIVSVARNLR